MMAEKGASRSQKALKLRERVKSKAPEFARPESWRYTRLKENWRRPRGLDNKVRKRIKGWPPRPSIGYRGPKIARGLHPSGYRDVLVHYVEDLAKVNSDVQAIRIAHTVGKRKRAKIVAEARRRKLVILNLKEVQRAVKKEELVKEKEKEKEEELEKEEEKQEEAEKEAVKPKKEKKKSKRKGRTEQQ
jgi:large subunit ribosomal protein L32e